MFESAGRDGSRRDKVDPGVRARDSDAGIHAQQIRRYRSMSPVRKLEIVLELSAAVDALLAAGIRQRQPQLDDAAGLEGRCARAPGDAPAVLRLPGLGDIIAITLVLPDCRSAMPRFTELTVAQLLVRNLDDAIVRALKERAARNGRSAEAEHREILRHVLLDRDPAEPDLKEVLLDGPEIPDESMAFFERRREYPRDIDLS